MTATVEISARNLAQNSDDAFAWIVAIDGFRCECSFTIRVLKKLIESLESDMTREEIANELGFKP